MRKFLLVLLIGIVLSACNTKEKRSERKTNEPKVYSNEFFSLEYPSDWYYEEEINDMADTIPAMSIKVFEQHSTKIILMHRFIL